VRGAWPIVEPGNRYIHGWHVDAVCEHLEAATNGEIRNLIVNVPPRHMKSLMVCVFWFCWVWTFKPESRWLYSSYGESLAIRDSLKCRRVVQSPWYQREFGHVFRLTGDQNQKTRFENDKTGYRLASSVGGAATGEGGDFLIADDPIKAKDAHSTPIRETANDWWDNTMSTRGNNPDAVVKVIIMQRLHEEDLTGHVLTKMEKGGQHYEHLCLPAEYEPSVRVTSLGWRDPRTEEGELLWPDRFTAQAIAGLKGSMGSYDVAGQLQQRPSPEQGGILKRAEWRYWRPKGVTLPPVPVRLDNGDIAEIDAVELPETFDEQAQSWDCAFKDTKTSDFVAGQVWGRVGANKYMLDYYKERADISGTIKAVEWFTAKWPKAIAKFIEDKANGAAVIQLLRGKVSGLIAVEPEGGKVSRAYAAQPEVESGNVYLPHPALFPWVDSFITSCAGFPNLAHDDDVDAFTQVMARWQMAIPAEKMVDFA
jgi:predicted phage terminase large subunit-like protein